MWKSANAKCPEELRQAKDQLESRVLERTTELASANRELMDNEEWLRLALAVAQVATWDWDLPTGKMRWSANPEVLFGFPAGSLVPTPEFHMPHTSMTSVVMQPSRGPWRPDYEVNIVRFGATELVVWIADRGRVVQDHEGNPPPGLSAFPSI